MNVDNDTDCQTEELKIAAEGHITTEALMWNQNRLQKTISGMVIYRVATFNTFAKVQYRYIPSILS